jgi:two-component system, cell cycle response regulator DivK
MPGECILVVDDNVANLKLMRLLLGRQGYEVEVSTGAAQALATLETFRPRVILMDLQMPGIDGLELTRRLKADPATRDITIVAVTAYAMKGDEAQARAAGCDGYLTKPIDTDTFPAALAQYLDP